MKKNYYLLQLYVPLLGDYNLPFGGYVPFIGDYVPSFSSGYRTIFPNR